MIIIINMNIISVSFFIITMGYTDAVPRLMDSQAKRHSLEEAIRDELIAKLINGSFSDNGVGKPEQKIIGGWATTSGFLPFQALLFIYKNEMGPYECGGSLITRRHILTAAHCLKGATGGIVVLGTSHKYGLFSPGAVTLIVRGNHFITHPDYDDLTFKNDIAIIRLTTQITLSFTIRTIALPTPQEANDDHFAGREAIISGFGKTSDYYDDLPEKLQMAYANITTLEECQKTWSVVIHDMDGTYICTRNQGSGTCRGDSGGPLVVEGSTKMTLVGVTSFGDTWCEKRVPSVYTNVASFLSWIQKVIKLN